MWRFDQKRVTVLLAAGGLEAQSQDHTWRDEGKARTEKATALSRLRTGACRVGEFVVLEIASGVWGALLFVFMAGERDDFQQRPPDREEEVGPSRRETT